MGRTATADSIAHLTQLDMVLDARLVLATDGATDAEWAANTALVNRYSKGAWYAEGRQPARRVTDRPIPAERTHIPAERDLPSGSGYGTRHATATISPDGPTTRQMEIVERLARKHLTPAAAETLIATARTCTVKTVSPIITALLDLDRKNPQGLTTAAAAPARAERRTSPADLDAELPDVTTGRYAVDGRHYKVDVPTRGRWVGRVFIHDIDADTDVRDHATKLAICTAIAADPYACATAFGKATGECCRCDDHLEDPESVARGIGPYCEAKILGISITELRRLRKANPMAV